MRELYKSYQGFDGFIKTQLMVMFVISLSWSLILPILTKLQGLLWATSIISAYLVLHRLSAFLLPYFKNTSLKQAYKNMIILDVLYLLSVPLYFIDPLLFLYTEAALMVIYGVMLSVFRISYDAFLMTRYDTSKFKDIQYSERIVMSVAGIIGNLLVIMLDVISSNIGVAIYTFMVILSVNVVFQLFNYRFHWNDFNLKETQIN